MDKELTSKQKEVLKAIKTYIAQNGFSPRFQDLRDILKFKTNNSLVQYFKLLEKKGYIVWNKEKRGIRIVTQPKDAFFDIPLLGLASCGQALCYPDNIIEEYIQISSKYIKGKYDDYFIIKADGTSMNNANLKINDQDLVLVKKMNNPMENDIVVAVVNGLATIKVFKRNLDKSILLVPRSKDSSHKPILLHPDDDVIICGKVEKVFNLRNTKGEKYN